MKTVVQKYGGTSVRNKETRSKIIVNANEAISEGYWPVIVVSAMGRYPEPYSTDKLLSLVPDLAKADPRNKDMISCLGEIITAVIVSEELSAAGLKAAALTGGQAGIITDTNYGEGNIIDIKTARLQRFIGEGIIPVVAGFQGNDQNGEMMTLGRGGSDITATALGGALNSGLVEIYTDVDGVMTADPNVVSDAQLIDEIEYEDIFLLAEYGAKVIHPRAVEYAKIANVPVAILNVESSRKGQHTKIATAHELQSTTTFSAITTLTDRSQVDVTFTSLALEDRMFKRMADSGISIDMVNILSDHRLFIISSSDKPKLEQVFASLGVDAAITDGFTKLSVLGKAYSGVPGIFAKIIAALYGNDITVYQSTDSSNTISVLIHTEHAERALNLLHEALILSAT
ncbi:MAG: aspartate kinase [Eubacteriaceae bacterium]|nr:aspartate kinase [Eubacteriaceae bacterium]